MHMQFIPKCGGKENRWIFLGQETWSEDARWTTHNLQKRHNEACSQNHISLHMIAQILIVYRDLNHISLNMIE